ncbi:MAG TPA: PIG-L family deacetylase [Planctomycetaceae bacterium]|jgi:LmbE family N-acetylglucosaminyl deacetylase|nr:PIG-L family deacetylase [Planctomycetaceae bacterium]
MAPSSSPPRILAIHAHPDDVEFQCAGTLALLKQQGCAITIATMTPGDCGSAEYSADEIAEIRRAEAWKSAELLGAEYVCLEFRDLAIVVDNPSRGKVCEALRRARPDIVLTAPPIDYMTDHEITSVLVREACFSASVPNYSTRQWNPAPPLTTIPYLYYVDAVEGIDWFGKPQPPDFIVDVTPVYELKQNMLACHESQRNWLRKQHGIDEYLERGARWSAARGREIGVKYGEAFRQHTGHPYPHDDRLGELVGGIRGQGAGVGD